MYAYYFILKVICWQCFIQALIFVLPIVMHIHTPSAAGPATPDEVLVLILCLYTSCRFMALYCLLLVPVCTNLNLHGAPRTPRGHTCCLLLFDTRSHFFVTMSCSFLSVGPCYVSSTINASCLTFHSCPCSVLKILFPSLRVMSLEMILVVPSSTFREIFLLRVRTAPSSCSEVVPAFSPRQSSLLNRSLQLWDQRAILVVYYGLRHLRRQYQQNKNMCSTSGLGC